MKLATISPYAITMSKYKKNQTALTVKHHFFVNIHLPVQTQRQKKVLFPEMRVTRKIFTQAAANLFLFIDFPEK